MKRLSFIIALALILTIGGVYATFEYTQAGTAVTDTNSTMGIDLADAVQATAKGSLSIEQNFGIFIDDYKGELKTGGALAENREGTITITFTVNEKAAAIIKNQGIDLKLTFTNAEYRNNDTLKGNILTVKMPDDDGTSTTPAPTVNTGNNTIHLPKGMAKKMVADDGTISFVFTLDLTEYIKVVEYDLPTLADYNEYKNSFDQFTDFKVTVAEDTNP